MTTYPFDSEILMARQRGLKAQGCDNREGGTTTIQVKKKKSTETKLDLFSESGTYWVMITMPVRTVSEANCTDHWTKKHKRHRIQQKTVALVLNPVREKIKLPCHITLTRYAPKKLDKHDNLPISLKYILDACCAIITGDFRPGRADDDERISVSYEQETSSHYGVKVVFTFDHQENISA